MAIRYDNRTVGITVPAHADKLFFKSFVARETLNVPYEIVIQMLSEDPTLGLDDLLGKPLGLSIELPEHDGQTPLPTSATRPGAGEPEYRHWHGIARRALYVAPFEGMFQFEVTVVPWLWFLSRNADNRIFQNKTVPDIIKEVFDDYQITDHEMRLSGTYPQLEYEVQYRESDLDFVHRLIEREGITYYFEHYEDRHVLIVTDGVHGHSQRTGFHSVRHFPEMEEGSYRRDLDHLWRWRIDKTVQPEDVELIDFDFKKPSVDLRGHAQGDAAHDMAKSEIYDTPGNYVEVEEGNRYSRLRMEEMQARYERLVGFGNCRGITLGSLFTLENMQRDDQKREYLVASTECRGTSSIDKDSVATGTDLFTVQVEAIDRRTPFRPQRVTPQPIARGPQTAIVVGPAGEEIHTDEYGRVKVQFHWDRIGKHDDQSSAWMRVSQLFVGGSWGAMAIPRVGTEVIVDFLEGDPNHPIVIGRVYNAETMPAYGLPDNKTMTVIKTDSSKGGGGFNEISWEDKKGSELVFVHAQKDMKVKVLDTEEREVDIDRKTKIGMNEKFEIGMTRKGKVELTDELEVGLTRKVKANVGITLECGASTIKMTPFSIELQSPIIKIGNAIIQIQGGIVAIQGGLVKIN